MPWTSCRARCRCAMDGSRRWVRITAMFSTWLSNLAVYEALARARRLGRFDEKEAVDDRDGETIGALKSPGPDPERQAFAGELRALIESAIEALPEHYR